MKNKYIAAIFGASMLASGCGPSETTQQLLVDSMELRKNCEASGEATTCEDAIASFDRNIPILKDRCDRGDQLACGSVAMFEDVIRKLLQAAISRPKGEIK